MDNVIVLENSFNDDGMCIVHLMSNLELTMDALKKYGAPVDVKAEINTEAGIYHLRATWPFFGVLEINCEGWPAPKIFVVWNLALCGSVRRAIYDAAHQYQDVFCERPQFAFIRKLPGGVDASRGVEVGDLMLFEAEWMVRKCVAVGWQTPPLAPPHLEERQMERGR